MTKPFGSQILIEQETKKAVKIMTIEKEEEVSEEDEEEEPLISEEELASLKEKAKKYDDLLPEFTKRSQLLSEIKKKGEEGKIDDKKDLDKIAKEFAEKEGWSEEEIKNSAKLVSKLLPALGYIPKEEAEKGKYDDIMQEQTDSFVEKHPEFAKKNDIKDEKWNLLMKEFGTYKLPANPKEISKLLEKARKGVFGDKNEDDGENRTLVKIAKNKDAMRGAGGGNDKVEKKRMDSSVIEGYRKLGWSDEDIESLSK